MSVTCYSLSNIYGYGFKIPLMYSWTGMKYVISDHPCNPTPGFIANNCLFFSANSCPSFFSKQSSQYNFKSIYPHVSISVSQIMLNQYNTVQTLVFVDMRFIFILYAVLALHVDTHILKRQTL